MDGDNELAVTPRLRFPEFESSAAWEGTTLGQVASFQSGGTPSKDTAAFWNGSIPWVTAKDMKRLFLDDTEDHITDAASNYGAKQVPAGTVLMLTRGMTLLKDVPICVLSRPMAFNQDVKALHAKAGLDGCFLPWLLLGNRKHLLRMVDVAGHGTGKLDTEKLKGLDVALPKPAEQQKIAECLKSLDEVIAAQGRKVEALKAHKRGLMQQLFPREGETVPRLRFPEFRDGPEWDVAKLEDLLVISATYGIVTAGEFQKEGTPMVRGGDIKDGAIGNDLPLVSAEIHGQYKRTVLQANDVVIALVGYPGEAAVVPAHYVGSNISRAVGLLRAKAQINHFYLVSYLNSPAGRQTVLKPSAGSAQVVVNLKHLNDLWIPAPNLKEQRVIAEMFAGLNGRLAFEVEKLAVLNTHKQGLMQQLFPSPTRTDA